MMSQNNYVKNFLKFFICIIIVFSLINAVNANEYNIIENTTVIDENTQINNNFIETNNNYTLESNTQSIDSLDEYNITENVHIKTLEEPYFKQDIDYINFTIFDDFLKGDNIRLSSADNECHFISQDFVLNHKGLPFVVKLVDNYGNPLINQTVVFTIHGVSYNKITDNDGNAKMNIRLNNGVYTIGFAFKGTSKYKSTSGTRTVSMISGMLNPNLDANVVNKYYGDSTPLKIYLKDNNYQPLTNKEITIRINGVTYTKTTDNNGYASMGISLYAGSYSAIIQFPGDTYYYGVTLNIPVTINKRTTSLVANDLTKYYNSDDKFFVRLLSDGNPLTNKVVKMTINGVAYDKITDNKGYVYSNVNLNPGTYQANVVFNGDNYYSSSSISKTLVVKEWLTTTLSANNLVKYYGDADSFNVKLTSENNVLTGKNINFNVNGVNYVKTTNNEGMLS